MEEWQQLIYLTLLKLVFKMLTADLQGEKCLSHLKYLKYKDQKHKVMKTDIVWQKRNSVLIKCLSYICKFCYFWYHNLTKLIPIKNILKNNCSMILSMLNLEYYVL